MILVVGIIIACYVVFSPLAMAQGRYGRGDRLEPSERAEKQTQHMTSELSLTEEQVSQVSAINLKYADKINEARDQNKDDHSGMRDAMMTMNSEKDEELKNVLTEDQYNDYEKLVQENHKLGGGKRKGRGY